MSISAASGMRSRMEALDLLANNIANANTTGFKADREFYNLYVSPEALEGSGMPDTVPVVERHWTDFSQGVTTPTGNPLDVALAGSGFFAVDGPNGSLYTRNGNFTITAAGTLQTQEGYAVRGEDGKPIKADPTKSILISTDGTVQQDGQILGRIAVVEIPQQQDLQKLGSTYFQMNDVKAMVKAATGVQLQQGRLEGANGAPAEHAVRLVSVMRQFEMLQKALSIGSDMNKRAIDEVARVS
ncbi:MAG: flagellar basal-body rod protein FlgF [Bryobacteraceae bacterium]